MGKTMFGELLASGHKISKGKKPAAQVIEFP